MRRALGQLLVLSTVASAFTASTAVADLTRSVSATPRPGSAAKAVVGAPRIDVGTRFMGKEPVGPLALVKDGKLVKVPRKACREWGAIGSHWSELDAYGKVVGETQVKGGEYYDVSRCDELTLKLVHGRMGAGVRVDVNSRYVAPDFKPFRPSSQLQRALETYANRRQSQVNATLAEARAVKVPFSKRVLYFSDGKNHTWAAIGGKTLLVARLNGEHWVHEYEQRGEAAYVTERAFLPFAATDMNADGQPEIVARREEGLGETYGDFVVSRSTDAAWQDRGWGIFGATA